MTTQIFLLGSTGMLGNYILKYLSNIVCIKCNAENDSFDDLKSNIKNLLNGQNVVLINCIGLIPQTGIIDDLKYIKINSIFPKYLDIICHELDIKLIHITTDCVFNGGVLTPYDTPQIQRYDEDSIKDETGIYGMSKSLGENLQNATIIRTSIIGETANGRINKSLLEWLKSNKSGTVNGFTNHYWNGVTCLQLAKIIDNIITTNGYWNGVRHIYSPSVVSKYELICMLNEIYNLNINIVPVRSNSINKSLISKYITPSIPELDIEIQIKEMYNFGQF
jgi:dTDP-4-dehydrorhamnose reductase